MLNGRLGRLDIEEEVTMGRRIAFHDVVYFDQLTEFANREGWRGETPGGQPVAGAAPEEVESWRFRWRTPDGAHVDFIDDEAIECQFLYIEERAADSVEPAVRESFDVLDVMEAAQGYLADPDREQRERFLRIIAGILPDHEDDETVTGVIMDGLHDTAPMVRLAAIIAAGESHLPLFRERLETLAAHDPDPNFRRLAKNSLDQLTS